MIYETFDSAFFITVISMIIGIIGLSIRYCLKSKCQRCIVCCGLIDIQRRVDLEKDEDIEEKKENNEI